MTKSAREIASRSSHLQCFLHIPLSILSLMHKDTELDTREKRYNKTGSMLLGLNNLIVKIKHALKIQYNTE